MSEATGTSDDEVVYSALTSALLLLTLSRDAGTVADPRAKMLLPVRIGMLRAMLLRLRAGERITFGLPATLQAEREGER